MCVAAPGALPPPMFPPPLIAEADLSGLTLPELLTLQRCIFRLWADKAPDDPQEPQFRRVLHRVEAEMLARPVTTARDLAALVLLCVDGETLWDAGLAVLLRHAATLLDPMTPPAAPAAAPGNGPAPPEAASGMTEAGFADALRGLTPAQFETFLHLITKGQPHDRA